MTRGFTLLEILVALALVALLAGLALPALEGTRTQRETAETVRRMEAIDAGTRDFARDTLRLPAGLGELVDEGAGIPGWCGPYLADVFLAGLPPARADRTADGWGRPFAYAVLAATRAELRSLGPDGRAGNADDLTRTLEATPHFREETRARLRVLNAALLSFVRQYRPAHDFPSNTDFASMVATLRARGLLNDDPRHTVDAWGNPFLPDPPAAAGRPVCRFRAAAF